MAATDVLNERVPGADYSCAAELFEAAHRSQSGLQPCVIGFDPVVRVLLGDVAGGGHQLIEHPWVGGGAIGGDLGRGRAVLEGAGEESPGGRYVPLLGNQNIDHLPELVDAPVQVDPSSGDLDVRLIHEPAITWHMSTRSCRIDQQRSETLHPPKDRNVIDSDAPLGQRFFHVSVGL
jgi:hypothetical protein